MTKKKRPIIDQTLEIDLKDLQLIYSGIQTADTLEISSPAFNHALNRAKVKIESQMKSHSKSMEPNKKYMEYITIRREICEKYSLKEKGKKDKDQSVVKPPIEGATSVDYVIVEGYQEDFNKEIDSLEKKYAKEIKARKDFLDQEDELLSSKRKIDIYKVIPENVPETINLGVMAALYKLIAFKAPTARNLKPIKIKKGKILSISKIMQDLASVTMPHDFVEKMAFNLWAIKETADNLYQEKAYEDYKQTEKLREELSTKHSLKYNHSGELVLYKSKEDEKNYFAIKDQDAFNKEFKKFKKDHQSTFDAYEEWLEEEITIKGYTFDIEDVPELPRAKLESITEFIEI
jgi:hypothetical protein